MLDEFQFTLFTTDAHAFCQTNPWLPKNATLSLGAYAVACVHQPHG
jgi:hypothetical protein